MKVKVVSPMTYEGRDYAVGAWIEAPPHVAESYIRQGLAIPEPEKPRRATVRPAETRLQGNKR